MTKPNRNTDDWAASYDDADRTSVAEILAWLEASSQTQSYLARLARLSTTTISQLLAGKYPTDPAKHLAAILAAIRTVSDRASVSSVPYVETALYRMLEMTADRARKYGNFGVLTGYVGVGKTAAIKHYQASHEHTVLIEANPNMTAGVLLRDLLAALAAPEHRSLDGKFANVVEAVRGTTKLIVIDEAETLLPQCLHYLRRIRDKAGIGVVLVGTEKLLSLLRVEHGQFDQIRSRVGFWPAPVKCASRADADAIAQAALSDQGELADEVLIALWAYCQGSVRMLVENFIPALRDYGLGKAPLSANLIDAVAEQVLFLPLRREAA